MPAAKKTSSRSKAVKKEPSPRSKSRGKHSSKKQKGGRSFLKALRVVLFIILGFIAVVYLLTFLKAQFM